MYKHLLVVITACVLCGCTVLLKTPTVADYDTLDDVTVSTTRNDMELWLGTPQGTGLHFQDGFEYDLNFYFGMAGKFSASKASVDSGTAFISFDGSMVRHALYFLSDSTGPLRVSNTTLPIIDLAKELRLGSSSLDEAIRVLGPPMSTGRRVDTAKGLIHNAAFWDLSQVQKNNKAIVEKWLMLGSDELGIVQDLMWASSIAEEVKEFGDVVAQRYNEFGILKPAGFIPYYDVQSIGTTTVLDATQVEALLERRPVNVEEFKEVLGSPTALGIKLFKDEGPMILSNWSFSEVKVKGRDTTYAEMPYMVIEFMVGRLLVAHTEDGHVKEILWFKPE